MAKPSFWDAVGGLFGRKESVRNSLELFREIYGGRASKSGVAVTVDRALQVSTVFACASKLANGVSQVPWRIYQEVDGRRKLATDHPLYRVIYRRPNAWQSSFEFRETIMFHLALALNAYVFLNRVGSKREIREMIPIEPGRMEVKREGYKLIYRVRGDNGTYQEFPAESIWHIRGPSWNSFVGMDALKLAREAIGLSIALEEDQAEFHKNGAQTSGLLSVKPTMGKEKYEYLAKWLDQYAPGGERHLRPMILDQGAEFDPMRMTGVDAQTLESRKFEIEEICRFYGILPIMIGHSGDKNATFASAEQMFLNHVVHGLMPWYERIEHSGDINLLSDADLDAGYYTKFTPQALMRGAANDRANYYSKALGSGGSKGWLTQNDVRSFEDLDKSEDPAADELPQATVAAVPAQSEPSKPPAGDA